MKNLLLLLMAMLAVACSSANKKDKKLEYYLESPNIRVEKFPQTFNMKGRGEVKTNCASNQCTELEADKIENDAAKNLVKDGKWDEYNELNDEEKKKKYSVLVRKGTYKEGIRDGFWEEYEEKIDENKVKKMVKKQEGNYKEGKKEGIWTTFYETGEKLKEIPYKDDKRHGSEKKFSKKGEQTEEIDYVEGIKQGKYWKKNTKGWLECKGEYNKDLKSGMWSEYNTEKLSDVLKYNVTYKDDKKNGPAVYYYPEGNTKMSEGDFKDNYKSGFWTDFYQNGNKRNETTKKPFPLPEEKDIKEEFSVCPGPNKIGKSVPFGEGKQYYQSGDLFSVGSYNEKGQPVKDWKFYHKGNKVKAKGTMNNTIMMQNGEIYDQNGELEGKGTMMLSMFSIDQETDEIKTKVYPGLPFTFYKDGKKYIEILNKTVEKPVSKEAVVEEESKKEAEPESKETFAYQYDGGGGKTGEGPYMFIPTQPYGGKKHGCWTEGGKKVYYLMGKVNTGFLAKSQKCE